MSDDISEPLSATPAKHIAIVTCMDARIDPLRTLGLRPGDAHVLRNAGGIITDDVLRSLEISQRRLGTREIILMHHTRCGLDFSDIDAAVRDAIALTRAHPSLPQRDNVRGLIYDVETGNVREVS